MVFLLLPALLFSAIFENRYFLDQEKCLNLRYISSKKIADNWYHAFFGQVNGDNDYKYYFYLFCNTNAEPVKFQLIKLNFIEEIQAENFDFTVYKEKEISFYYKTSKNNLYFYTQLRFGDKINTDLFSRYKNSKDSFLYYSQKDNTVIHTPNAPPGWDFIPGISSNICYAFKYAYDNKEQFYIKIASKDKYYIYFIKPPYTFSSFENNSSIFDASEKQLPIFDSIENDLANRIEEYNIQRICDNISRDYHNKITGMLAQKDNRDHNLPQFLNSSFILVSISDVKQVVKSNLNYYYNDSSDLFVPYRFHVDNSLFDVTNFIINPFEEAYHSRFNMENFQEEYDYFLEFQKNYNSADPVLKSVKSDNYLDFYKNLLNSSYSNTTYFTNIKTIETNFLFYADTEIETSFKKYFPLLTDFSNGLAYLENMETRFSNNFYDGIMDSNKKMAEFYNVLMNNIPQVLVNYRNYINELENSGYIIPEKVKLKTNSIINDFTEYSFQLISDYYDNIQDKLTAEYSCMDEGTIDLLSKDISTGNKKFLNQCRTIVSNSYAYMAKHSLFKYNLSNLIENKTLIDYLNSDKEIDEFCQSNQFYSIDKENFIIGLIQKNIMDKKFGNAPFPVNMKIWNPIHFYTNYFTNSFISYSRNLTAEKFKSDANIPSLFPAFIDYIKKVSQFYNELSKNLNLKNKNNHDNGNKIIRDFKYNLQNYLDIKNFFHEYLSELKAGYTDAIRDFSKISSERNYFQNRIQLLSGNYRDFNAETRTFFYGDDYQQFLNQLAHDALFENIFKKSSAFISGQKDFIEFEAAYKKVYQQMVLDFSDLMKQYQSLRSIFPDFNKYDICFRTNSADEMPQLLTQDKKKTIKETVEDRIMNILTDEDFLNCFLDRDSLKKAIRSGLTRQDSGIDLSGMMISEAGQNSISIRIGELGYHINSSNLVYELKRVRAIDNNLWIIFSTTSTIPESFVDKIDLTKIDTLNIPDSFEKMLSENKLIRGDYYDDVVMIYPGCVLLYKHGSTDNSTKNDNNLKRLVVLDYSSGKFIIRNDASAQLKELNDLFNEKIDAIYSYYDEKKKETELIVNMRNNILFLRYNKNGFVNSSREESLLKNSFIFTDGLNKYVFKYRLTGY